MKHGKVRGLWVMAALTLCAWLTACGDCEDETAAAQQFLTTPSNLVCQSDADCKVVLTGCTHPARGFCGQATLNQTAAASSRWKTLQTHLNDCDNECINCAALLEAHCASGFCGGPP
jgi:hypothetical protein